MSDPITPGRRGRRRSLRTRLVLGFGSISLLSVILTVLTAVVVVAAIESYHPYWFEGAAHFVFGVTPRVSDTAAGFILLGAVLVLVLIIVSVSVLVSRRVLEPVAQLAAAADRVAGGDLEVQLRPRGDDELATLVDGFNGMTAQVRASVEDLRRHEAQARRFASDVAHELRSPLAAMTAVTEMLEFHSLGRDDDAARATRLVVTSVTRLERLVEDLLEISRLDAGTVTLQRESVRVAEAVAACLAIRDWGDRVGVEVPSGLHISADRRRLDVILANLIGNALGHGGGAPVEVRATALDLATATATDTDGAELVLAVRDHGPGLVPEAIGSVFDRFYKADSARSASGGSGLGLAIAQENARLHGGSISAANARSGTGAIFTLRLPGVVGSISG